MHIYKSYSKPSSSDYFDNCSELAVCLTAKINHLLTHSFRIANDNGFQFSGHPLGHCCTDGNVRVVMCLFHLPTHCLIEDHLDVTPSMNLDAQLVTNLLMMMEKACPGLFFLHCCCAPLSDLSV